MATPEEAVFLLTFTLQLLKYSYYLKQICREQFKYTFDVSRQTRNCQLTRPLARLYLCTRLNFMAQWCHM